MPIAPASRASCVVNRGMAPVAAMNDSPMNTTSVASTVPFMQAAGSIEPPAPPGIAKPPEPPVAGPDPAVGVDAPPLPPCPAALAWPAPPSIPPFVPDPPLPAEGEGTKAAPPAPLLGFTVIDGDPVVPAVLMTGVAMVVIAGVASSEQPATDAPAASRMTTIAERVSRLIEAYWPAGVLFLDRRLTTR